MIAIIENAIVGASDGLIAGSFGPFSPIFQPLQMFAGAFGGLLGGIAGKIIALLANLFVY